VSDARREFDHLEPARNLAQCVRQQLALLARDRLRQRLLVLLDQLAKTEHHPRTAANRHLRPRLKGTPSRRHRRIDDGLVGQPNPSHHRTAGRIEHIPGARRTLTRIDTPADPVPDISQA